MSIQFTNRALKLAGAVNSYLLEQIDEGGYLSCLATDCCSPNPIAENDKVLLQTAFLLHYLYTGFLPDADGICPCLTVDCSTIDENLYLVDLAE